MILSSRALSTARRLIEKYGQSISFSSSTGGSFVPGTGAITGETIPTYTVYGAPIEPGYKEVNDKTAQESDLIVLLEVNISQTVPLIGDVATVSGVDYHIFQVRKTVINGQDVLYKIYLKI